MVGAVVASGTVGAAPAVAQDVSPNDFGAVGKVVNVNEVDDNTTVYKLSIKSGGEKIGKATKA